MKSIRVFGALVFASAVVIASCGGSDAPSEGAGATGGGGLAGAGPGTGGEGAAVSGGTGGGVAGAPSGGAAGAPAGGTAGAAAQAGETATGGTGQAGETGTGGTGQAGETGTGGSGTGGAEGGSGGSGTGGETGGTAGAVAGSAGAAGHAAEAGAAGAAVAGAPGTGGAGGSATGGSGGAAAGAAGAAGAGGCTVASDCDDGLGCNGVEDCVGGACVPGSAVQCPNNDGVSCTIEVCVDPAGICSTVPQDSLCLDNDVCNGAEQCDPGDPSHDVTTGCVAGTALSCGDGATCTIDDCDPVSGCSFTPLNANCTDGDFCTGDETCSPGAAGADPTSGCVAGTPPDCSDGVDCTVDDCFSNACQHTADDNRCDDGLSCNGAETCDETNDCQAGSPIVCTDDGHACTIEGCTEAVGCTIVEYRNSECAGNEMCTASGCQAGTGCPSGTDAECDDSDACNGAEWCDTSEDPNICRSGTPPTCDDGFACTFDSCNAASGCVYTPIDLFCSDSDVCTGTEICDPNHDPSDPNWNATTGCLAGTPLGWEDGASCTDDSCDPTNGPQRVYRHTDCADAQVCNGAEVCDPTAGGADPLTGCAAGTPLVCPDDGIACTNDYCSQADGGCVNEPDHSVCGCGETCDPASGGCVNLCVVGYAACQGKVYQCADCIDNDGDCLVDAADDQCFGVCDNNEAGLHGEIPGQNAAPCKMDCYFDQDTGAGNDECYWSHKCDPNEEFPPYHPQGTDCPYDPNANIPGYTGSCYEASVDPGQYQQCLDYCLPLVPNGCDCFGCCVIPDAPGSSTTVTVYLGSVDYTTDDPSCTLPEVADPDKCHPCVQVDSCLNTCEHCELCIGKTELPPDCTQQQCPPGIQPCGLPGQDPCPQDYYCVTGCCIPEPQ